MDRPLEGKVAIVTGAGSRIGFGRSMTLALVNAGARVAMVDINADTLEQTANEVEETTGEARLLQVVGETPRSGAQARNPPLRVGAKPPHETGLSDSQGP